MKGYQAVFVCRLCGAKYYETHIREEDRNLAVEVTICACSRKPSKGSMSPWLNEAHFCKDGSIGVGDFQGYQKQDN